MSVNRLSGTVKFYDEDKGYGFIKPNTPQADGAKDYFVHASSLRKSGLTKLDRDAKVTFEAEDTAKGMRAVAIELVV